MRSSFIFRTAGVALFAALTVLLVAPRARAAGASLSAATAAQKKTASEHYAAGLKASRSGDNEQALKEFRASYDTVASPNSHLMVGRALEALGRKGEAYAAYDQTVSEAEAAAESDPKYKKTAKAAERERDQLRPQVAFVNVHVAGAGPDDELVVGDRTIDRSDWDKPIAVTPGGVQVELRSPGSGAQTRTVNATAGGTNTVELSGASHPSGQTQPVQAEASSSGMNKRTLAYVAGGIGAAGLVTFAVFGVLNNSKYNDLQKSCPNNLCPASRKSDADTGSTYQTIANVGLGVGVVGVVSGAILYFLSTKQERGTATNRPRLSVGLRSVRITGKF